MCKREQDAIVEECFAYDEELFRTGRVDAGAVLQGTPTAKTLRWKSGKVMVTDGPFAETGSSSATACSEAGTGPRRRATSCPSTQASVTVFR